MPKQSGYSLIELLIVIAIMAMVTAALIPTLYTLNNSKDLQVESENLLSKLQLQRSSAIEGVSGTWYGVSFNPTTKNINFYHPTDPNRCTIYNRDLLDAGGSPCDLNKEDYLVKGNIQWQIAITTISPDGIIQTKSIDSPVEARFNRAQNSYQIVLLEPNISNSPLLRRLRITLQGNSQTSTIAIDGGNICNEKSYENSPFPCDTYTWGGTRYYGGAKEGRIFLVN